MPLGCPLLLNVSEGAKQGSFAASTYSGGRLSGSTPSCPLPAARYPREIVMQAAVPTDKSAPNRLSERQTV